MPLIKLKDFYPNYRNQVLGGEDVEELEVYAGLTDEKIGRVCDDVVNFTGQHRYLVVDTSFWGIVKKILLPVEQCRLDYPAGRVYAVAVTDKKQVQELPEYTNGITVNYNLKADQDEETFALLTDFSEQTSLQQIEVPVEVNQSETQIVELYEERLNANKTRQQTGEVFISKRIEEETIQFSVPLERERIIIHRQIPINKVINSANIELQEGIVARIKVYEETANIQKEVVLREEITIAKAIQVEAIYSEETLRHEELEIQTEGQAIVEKPD